MEIKKFLRLICKEQITYFTGGQNRSFDEEGSVLFHVDGPFYQRQFTLCNLKTGDTARMHTAAAVDVEGGSSVQAGTMGVSGDQVDIVLSGKGGKAFFCAILPDIVFGGTGRIKDAEVLKRAPDVAHQKTGENPEGRVKEISLMSVGEIEVVAIVLIFQDQAFVETQGREEILLTLGITAKIRGTLPAAVMALFLFHIMISIEHDKTVFLIKP